MPSYSQSTKSLLNDMMKDSKLNAHEQRKLRLAMEMGGSLPVRRAVQPPPAYKRPYQDPLRGIALNPRLCPTVTTKSRHAILVETRGYDRPQYGGGQKQLRTRAEEVERLQNRFAFGEDAPAPTRPPRRAAAMAAPPPQPARSEEAKLHEEITAEIAERQEFLASMRAAGRMEHDATIQQQIGERMGDLRALERMMGSAA